MIIRKSGALAAVVVALVASPAPASAHNAGHMWMPDGSCHQVGSFKPAPMVGPAAAKSQLDLAPETANPPFDEYGTSFVGYHGHTPIFPGPCPA